MDSDSKAGVDDGESSTKYVLDYYKKYSLNKDLPKYFSGTSVSYLPEIKDESENPEVVITADIDIIITEESKEVINEEPLDTSRASSVMSNRKLEWDNGADIGYDNILDIKLLRKSSSLPLLTDLKRKKVDRRRIIPTMEDQGSKSSSDSNLKIMLHTQSSSSECPSLEIDNACSSSSSAQPEEEKITSLSSNNVESNVLPKHIGTSSSSSDSSSKLKIMQFANTLLYLKKKIGVPDAHSTPKYPEGRKSEPELLLDTPVIKNLEEIVKYEVKDKNKPSTSKSTEENLPIIDRTGRKDILGDNNDIREGHVQYRKKRVINLAITTPVMVECVCREPEKNPKSPPVQTVTTYTTIGVQTDSITEQELIQAINIKKKSDKNQSLLFFEYSESDGTNSRSIQTSSDMVVSYCDSFEFLKNSPEEKNDLQTSKLPSEIGKNDNCKLPLTQKVSSNIEPVNIVPQTGILRRSQRTEDLRTVPADEIPYLASGDFSLKNIVSTNQLDNLGDDIEKSISLLQKLLKSKKYDPTTKKRYIKKIVKKITESKFLEESSTSSDLFFPKKSKPGDFPVEHPALTNSDSSDEKNKVKSSELKLPESSSDSTNAKNTLLSDSPCDRVKLSPRKKLVLKTFTQNFLPKQILSSRDEVSSPPEIIPTDSRDTRRHRFTLTNNEFLVKHKSDETQINKSPRETENTSLEKQYESLSSSNSASYENWREDKTLSEKLLEEQPVGRGSGDCLVQVAERERKYQINWINNEISHLGKLKCLLEKPALELSEPRVKKTTTVYTVSSESDIANNAAKNAKHKYVIETHLSAYTSKDAKYETGNKKYTVHKANTKKSTSSKKTAPIELGVLDVVSGDNTTNIKVSAFCTKCKRAPCICDIERARLCQVCRTCPCICPSNSKKKMPTGGFENVCICRKCRTAPCVCVIEIPRLCQVCRTCPCICPSNSKKKMPTGDFENVSICQKCKRAPCICVIERARLCQVCRTCPCICPSNSKKKMPTGGFGNVSICEKCKRIYNIPSTQSMLSGKTICIDCHRATCTCSQAGLCPSVDERYCYYSGQAILNSRPTEDYAGTFIPVDMLKSSLSTCYGKFSRKFSTYPSTVIDGARRNLIVKSLVKCTDCERAPCVCHLRGDGSTSTICLPTQNGVEVETGSLEKVFENCSCTSQGKCHCGFVQKLIEHFDIAEIPTSILKDLNYNKDCQANENEPNSSCQTVTTHVKKIEAKRQCLQAALPNSNCQTVSTQVKTRTKQQCLQTALPNSSCQTVSTQVKKMETKQQSVQTALPNSSCQTVSTQVEKMETKQQRLQTALPNSSCQTVSTQVEKMETKQQRLQTALPNSCCQTVSTQVIMDPKQQCLQTTYPSSDAQNEISQTQDCGYQHVSTQAHVNTNNQTCQTYRGNLVKQTVAQDCRPSQLAFQCQGTQTALVKCSSGEESDKKSKWTCCKCPSRKNAVCASQVDSDRLQTCSSRATSSHKCSECNKTKKYIKFVSKQTLNCENKSEQCKSDTLERNTIREILSNSTLSSIEESTAEESNSEESTSKTTTIICVCCKEPYMPDNRAMQGGFNQHYPLCQYCSHRRPILTSQCYAWRQHVCTCYKPVSTSILQEIKNTVNQLHGLEHCTCENSGRMNNQPMTNCSYCQYKLAQTTSSRKGIAYTLTLESESPRKVKSKRKKKKPPIEEIRIKIPSSYNRKKYKDKENSSRKDNSMEKIRVGMDGVINTNSGKDNRTKTIVRNERSRSLTLQEYLRKNRPEFIESAEYRRQAVRTARSERELNKEEKKLRFLDENTNKNRQKKRNLFTEQEMKEITKRNYKKLPEIRQRVNNAKELKLRSADKFITEMFTKKIHDYALKGKRTFPIDRNIVSLPKT